MQKKLGLYFIVLFFLLTTLFSLRYVLVGQAVYGDGIYYWAYTRSLVIDGNLDLRNEGGHLYGPQTNNTHQKETFNNNDDLKYNKYYPIGVSLLWLLPFASLHLLLQGTKLFFPFILVNGYADGYQLWIGIINIGFVTIGLHVAWRTLSRFFNPKLSFTALVLTLFATNLIYYASLDVINSHPASFLLASFFVFFWIRMRDKPTIKRWFLLGVLLGVMTCVRPQDVLYGLLLPFTIQKKRVDLSVAAFAGFALGYLPQILASLTLYHQLVLPYTTATFFIPESPKVLEIIFNAKSGLLFFAPLYLVSFFGLFLLQGKCQTLKIPFLSVVLSQIILISVWSGWSQGEAFGTRMLISTLPVLVFGVASVLQILGRLFSKATVLLISLAFIVHNLLMIVAFHLFLHNLTYIRDELSRSGKVKQTILSFLGGLF